MEYYINAKIGHSVLNMIVFFSGLKDLHQL